MNKTKLIRRVYVRIFSKRLGNILIFVIFHTKVVYKRIGENYVKSTGFNILC
jgi:hypothetical protein